MKAQKKVNPLLVPSEKKSISMLVDKMGMSYPEVQEIISLYGVSASQLVERMQLSKYPFVYSGKVPGQCASFPMLIVRMRS